MRAFLTGSSGFVGGYLSAHLRDCGDEVAVADEHLDLSAPDARDQLVAELSASSPQIIYHLAALTHVGKSWSEPAETMRVNALGTLSVLEAARALENPPRVLLVSSAEVYGPGDGTPITEDDALAPVSPYAASKVSAEYLGLQAFLGRGLEVVRARPFNHVGAGQGDAFVVSALARRIADAEREGAGHISVGNLDAARDFTDVRDVVRAYRELAALGVAGEVYNVCSGKATSIAEIFEMLLSMATVPLEAKQDPELFRPVDVPLLVGDAGKLRALTGWQPEHKLEETLAGVLEAWRKR